MKFLLLLLLSNSYFGFEPVKGQSGTDSSKFGLFRSCLPVKAGNSVILFERSNSKEYSDLNYQWNQGPAPLIQPLAYLLVKNERDVMAAVQCGTFSNITLVAKGGGHSFEKYSFGDSDSVIVDLQLLNQITVNTTKNIAVIGAGVLLGPLYYALWRAGDYFTPTGDCGTVGIPGVATGGGFGILSRKYGLTSDNIVEMRIVTADGKLRRVNRFVNSDLFWALRGGGGASFGIVTRFEIQIYKAPPKIFYGNLVYDIVQFPEVFTDWQRYVTNPLIPDDVTGIFIVQNKSIIINIYDLSGRNINFNRIKRNFPKPGIEGTETFVWKDFMLYLATNSSGETYTTRLNTTEDLATLNRMSSIEVRVKMKSFYVSRTIGKQAITALNSTVAQLPPNVLIIFDAYGGAVNRIPPRSTAFVHRRTLYLAFAYYGDAATEPNDPKSIAYVGDFFDFGVNVFRSEQSYQNYVDRDLKDYLQRYYGENLQRLIRVKREIDPNDYFCSPQSIPTK